MPVRYNINTTWKKELRQFIREESRSRCALAGETVRWSIRNQIPPPKQGNWAARASLPDEEGTGALKESISVSDPIPFGGPSGGYRCRVFVNMAGDVRKYALIHEVGGTITAKGKTMTFFSIPHNRVIDRYQVYIRPKYYFRDGVEQGDRTIASGTFYDARGKGSSFRSARTGRFIKR